VPKRGVKRARSRASTKGRSEQEIADLLNQGGTGKDQTPVMAALRTISGKAFVALTYEQMVMEGLPDDGIPLAETDAEWEMISRVR